MKRLTTRDESGYYHLRRGPKGGEINKITVVQHLGRLEDVALRTVSRERVEKVFGENQDMDGLFCSSDIIAATAIQEAARREIAIPSSLKIVGFDDTWYSSSLTPSLTTVRQPIKEMAMIAISSLEAALKAGSFPSSTIKLDVSLVVREST